MTFLFPSAFWLLGFLSLPIIIHILNRFKLRKVEYSSVSLIEELKSSAIYTLNLKKILILFLRLLFITSLILMFARPVTKGFIPGWFAAEQDASLVIIIDNSASMTATETKKIDRAMSNLGTHFRMVSKQTMDILNDPVISVFCTTYTNAFIRAGKTPRPEEAAEGLGQFIMDKFKKEIDKLKTPAGKQRRMDAMQAVVKPLASIPGHELVSVFHLYYGLQEVKNIIIKKLSSAGFIKTFLKTKDGWQVTGQEGYVATDSLGKNSVKLVDRLEFSYANFSDDVIKGWQSDFRR